MVHHGGDPIEAVAIELELIHPPARVGEQEAQRLPAACSFSALQRKVVARFNGTLIHWHSKKKTSLLIHQRWRAGRAAYPSCLQFHRMSAHVCVMYLHLKQVTSPWTHSSVSQGSDKV